MSEPTDRPDHHTHRRRSLPPQSQRPFQLVLTVGDAPRDTELADSFADVTAPAPDAAPEAFAATGLAPSDLRSRTMFLLGATCDLDAALGSYATAVGFASRYLDVATPDGVVVSSFHRAGRELADAGKAPERADLVVVVGPTGAVPADLPARVLGDEADGSDVRVLSFVDGSLDHLGPDEVSELRSARRVALAASADPHAAFRELLVLSGLRSRRNFERLPVLVRGELCADLDELRRRGAELRKSHRGYLTSLAPTAAPTAHQAGLQEAAAVPMAGLLEALGSECSGELWQCPRPWSHTHGDATASMQVSEDNKVRCYVDDAEWIDPVRLVMEVCSATPDEAAELLTSPDRLADHRRRILAERARRAG